MSILNEICDTKRAHIEVRKGIISLHEVQNRAKDTDAPLNILKALKANKPNAIIAEIKKGSPSAGTISENFDPVHQANHYIRNGAACISILTDSPYFQGHDDDLRKIRPISTIPVLRKDFMLDIYQIYESRMLGADCVLLIMAALSDSQANELYECALSLGMDCLIEVHNHEELERALTLNPDIIGVNNRNLKTMEVSLQTSVALSKDIPDHIFKISESGIQSKNDIKMLKSHGYQGFLIGQSLMQNTTDIFS